MFDDKFQRLEGESIEEYQMRLSIMKLKEGYDIDWSEIKELLQSDEHPDTLRRKGKGLVMGYEIYENKMNKLAEEYYLQIQKIKDKVDAEIEDKRLVELQNKILQLKVEKEKLKNERNHLNAQVRIIARVEHLEECMANYIIELSNKKPLLGNVELTKEETDKEGVCLLSDIHYGAETDNILDCYNPQICKEKLNYYCSKIIQYGKDQNIKILNVLGLGDYVTGLIHNVNRFDSRLLITEQIIGISELLAEFINELSKHFYIKYALVQGNHSRIVANKDNSIYEENFTEFIRTFVVSRLKDNKNVEYIDHEDVGIVEAEVKGKKIVGIHGDQDRDNALNRLIEMFDYKVDYVMRGHFHQSKQFDVNKTVIVNNGCFAGENYGKNARLYNEPIQKFMIFTDEGMICCYDINLNNYKKNE